MNTSPPHRLTGLAFALSLLCSPAQAVILFGLDNDANQSDPMTGVPYASVGRAFNGVTLGGSAVHVGNGWMLTADHVNPFNFVTFDGTSSYAWNGDAPIQLGTSDMKLFRLSSIPSVPAAQVYGGTLEQIAPATMVGWGVGRLASVPVDSNSVTWGSDATSAPRWGLNTPRSLSNISYSTYSYQAIITVLGSDTGTPTGLGDNEAAATLYDSGGGLFQEISGNWYLIGIATAVETSGTSLFGNDQAIDPNGDINAFVRVSNYESTIMGIIPEPSAALLGCLGFAALLRRRR